MLRLLAPALLTLLALPALAELKFMGLGDLDGDGFFSEAFDVSGDGSTIVGRSDSTSGTEAFRWTESGGMIGLGDLPGGEFRSKALSASQDGSVIVGYARSESGLEIFRWTAATDMVGLGPSPNTFGGDVSDDGSVIVGTFTDSLQVEAFRWTQATDRIGLGTIPGDQQSFGEAVSGDGSIVVGSTNHEAFRWTQADEMAGLGDLQTSPVTVVSEAYGISADGTHIVGGARNDADEDEPFRWDTVTQMKGLGPCPSAIGFVAGADVSADGSVVVGPPSVASDEARAFIWDEENGCRLLQDALSNELGLDLSGWTLSAATGISDDGSIVVGFGENPLGQSEAWMAVIESPPRPVPALSIAMRLIIGCIVAGLGFVTLHRRASAGGRGQ
jgi:probable HAF family extracellular repeat protein